MEPTSYDRLTDEELLALCVWREASNQGSAAWSAVANVIRNRTLVPYWWNGHVQNSYRAVILHPYQFSSFNSDDPNQCRWPDEAERQWNAIKEVCQGVFTGMCPDITDGATYYISYPLATPPPKWGPMNLKLRIQDMRFFVPTEGK